MKFKYVVVEAGLVELGSACHLEQNGKQDWLILEKNNRAGGLCRSEMYEGFTFEHSIFIAYTRDFYAGKRGGNSAEEEMLAMEEHYHV